MTENPDNINSPLTHALQHIELLIEMYCNYGILQYITQKYIISDK